MGDGGPFFSPVAVEDVACCFTAVTEPMSIRETFDVCGRIKLTMPQILREILAATGRKRLIIRVPLNWRRRWRILDRFFAVDPQSRAAQPRSKL